MTLRRGLSPGEEFSTLAREMLHRNNYRGKTTKRMRETEADSVAFVVCQAAGLDTNSAASD